MPDQPKRGRQRRLARSWDDVPAPLRQDVRIEADGDLRRVELVDRPDGGYTVTVHPAPVTIDPDGTLRALGSDPAMGEVIRRTRPQHLSEWQRRRNPERPPGDG